MQHRFSAAVLLIAFAMILSHCKNTAHLQGGQPLAGNDSTMGLKDYYQDYFPIGVAVSPWALKTDDGNLVLKNFNSLTPENDMKMGSIHPKENEYNWRAADSIMAFAERNGLQVRGHNLCWHNQTPAWIFKDGDKTVSKKVLLQRLKDHIKTVVDRHGFLIKN